MSTEEIESGNYALTEEEIITYHYTRCTHHDWYRGAAKLNLDALFRRLWEKAPLVMEVLGPRPHQPFSKLYFEALDMRKRPKPKLSAAEAMRKSRAKNKDDQHARHNRLIARYLREGKLAALERTYDNPPAGAELPIWRKEAVSRALGRVAEADALAAQIATVRAALSRSEQT